MTVATRPEVAKQKKRRKDEDAGARKRTKEERQSCCLRFCRSNGYILASRHWYEFLIQGDERKKEGGEVGRIAFCKESGVWSRVNQIN